MDADEEIKNVIFSAIIEEIKVRMGQDVVVNREGDNIVVKDTGNNVIKQYNGIVGKMRREQPSFLL